MDPTILFQLTFTFIYNTFILDFTGNDQISRHGKTGGSGRVWVGSIGSRVKTGHGSKRVIFKLVNRVAGQTGRGLSRVTSRVKLTRIFQKFFFFFFEVDAICQLFMSFFNYN